MITVRKILMGPFTKVKTFLSMSALLAGSALLSQGAIAFNDENNNEDIYNFEHATCNGDPFEIRIVLTNVKKSKGNILVDLYKNEPETFLRSVGRIQQDAFAAEKGNMKFCIHAPEADLYAIGLYHDKNANGDLDKGAFGIPSEYWGISLDTKKRFKAPPIEKTLFDVKEEGYNLTIKLRKR